MQVRKFFFLALLGQLVSILPQKTIQAQTVTNEEVVVDEETESKDFNHDMYADIEKSDIAADVEIESIENYTDKYTYTYNDQGIRTSKSNGTTTIEYFLDGSLVLFEKTGNDVIYYTYDVDGSLLSMNYNGDEYFYIKNL